uniref:Uncharacterized protein n=1 Tax=Oryza meridionalis TaxID=40149 RepID=A0A0E0CAJ7_9ORYZ
MERLLYGSSLQTCHFKRSISSSLGVNYCSKGRNKSSMVEGCKNKSLKKMKVVKSSKDPGQN